MVAVFSAAAWLRRAVQGRIPAVYHVFHHVEIGPVAIDLSRLFPLHGSAPGFGACGVPWVMTQRFGAWCRAEM